MGRIKIGIVHSLLLLLSNEKHTIPRKCLKKIIGTIYCLSLSVQTKQITINEMIEYLKADRSFAHKFAFEKSPLLLKMSTSCIHTTMKDQRGNKWSIHQTLKAVGEPLNPMASPSNPNCYK